MLKSGVKSRSKSSRRVDNFVGTNLKFTDLLRRFCVFAEENSTRFKLPSNFTLKGDFSFYRYPQGISLGWEVPLTMSSNRLLVSARFNGSASEFSNETNSHGVQTDTSQSTKGAVVAGRVNSGSGSEAYYIFSIK